MGKKVLISNEEIVNGVASLILQNGLEDFSVDEVVNKTGISKGTIYNRFRSRDNLLIYTGLFFHKKNVALLQRSLDHIFTAREKLFFALWFTGYLYDKYPDLLEVFHAIMYGGSAVIRDTLREQYVSDRVSQIEEILYEGYEVGEFDNIDYKNIPLMARSIVYSNDSMLVNNKSKKLFSRILDLFKL